MEKPEHPGPCATPASLRAFAEANSAYSEWLATNPPAESETEQEAPPPKPVKGAK